MSQTFNIEKYSDAVGLKITKSSQKELEKFKRRLMEDQSIEGLLKSYLTSNAAVSYAILSKKDKVSIGTTLLILLYKERISFDFIKILSGFVSEEEIEKECINKFLGLGIVANTAHTVKTKTGNKHIEKSTKNNISKATPLPFDLNITPESDDINLYSDLFHLINSAEKDVIWIKHFKPSGTSESEDNMLIKEAGSQNINNWVWQLFPLIIAARGGLTTGAKGNRINFTIIIYTKHSPKRVGHFSALLGIGANIVIKDINENPLPEGFVIDYNTGDPKFLLLSTSNNKRTLSEINKNNLNHLTRFLANHVKTLTKNLKENTYIPTYSEIHEDEFTTALQEVSVYELKKGTIFYFEDNVKQFIEHLGAENIACANRTIKVYKKKQLPLIQIMYERDNIKNKKFIAVNLEAGGKLIRSIVALPTIEKDDTGIYSLVDGHTRVDHAFFNTNITPFLLVQNPTTSVKFSSTLSDLLEKPDYEKYVEKGSREHLEIGFRNLDSKIHKFLWREFDSVWDELCKDIDFFIE